MNEAQIAAEVEEALENAADNGFADAFNGMSPKEILDDLVDYDSGFGEMGSRELQIALIEIARLRMNGEI
jgi:hypothetical protein